MKAYWTIIKDAFQAAVVSKVLYVMLAIIGVILLALAPLGYKELMDYAINPGQIRDPEQVAERLIEASKSEEESQLKAIWNKLPANSQKRINDLMSQIEKDEGTNPLARAQQSDFLRIAIGDAFRNLVKQDDWFDAKYLNKEEASEELLKLAEETNLASEKMWRRNRLAFDNLFPLEIRPSGGTVMQFGWLGMYPFEALALTRAEFQIFATITIPWILDKLVLSIGVLIAILFTANMVPELLEPGSLNLLLSKPMSRTGLFVSKFIGACSFALLTALILFIGIWLILGIRLDMWNLAFLACIPIYVFVFAIYYSVSAFVGLLTRSTILSIVAAIVFWVFCFSIGFTYLFFNDAIVATEAQGLVVQGDRSLMLDRMRRGSTVDEKGEWTDAFKSADSEAVPAFVRSFIGTSVMAGPISDPTRDRFVIISAGIGDGPRRPMADMNLMSSGPDTQWNTEVHQAAPPYTTSIQKLDDESMVLVTMFGEFYRLKFSDLSVETPAVENEGTITVQVGGGPSEVVEETPMEEVEAEEESETEPAVADVFENVTPLETLPTGSTRTLAYDAKAKAFALWHEGLVHLVRWNGTRFEVVSGEQFEIGEDQDVDAIAFGGGQVYLQGNDEIVIIDVANKQMRRQAWKGRPITSIVADAAGVGALILDADGYLWRIRPDGQISGINGRSDGSFRAITVNDAGECWAIERFYSLEKIDLQEGRSVDVRSQPTGTSVSIYRYVVSPIYEIAPKPGEFYKMVRALVIVMNRDEKDETKSEEGSESDEQEITEEEEQQVGELDFLVNSDAWKPATNGIIFIGVMMLLSVLVFRRLDL